MSFTSPLILSALALLPLLYLLIRLFPPAPKIIAFPAFRLLNDLSGDKQTMQKAPLWLRLLRLAIVACLIIGLSGPVHNPQSHSFYTEDLHLIIQNDWASGQSWPAMRAQAETLLEIAQKQERNIILTKTNLATGENPEARSQITSSYEALQQLKSITPQPLPIDGDALEERLAALAEGNSPSRQTLWIGTGLSFESQSTIFNQLLTQGGLDVFAPDDPQLSIIKPDQDNARAFEITSNQQEQPSLILKDAQGASIARLQDGDTSYQEGSLTLDRAYSKEAAQISIEGESHAGATYLRRVGSGENRLYLVTPSGAVGGRISLANPMFYLYSALSELESINLSSGDISEFLQTKETNEESADMLILPDTALTEIEQDALSDWIKHGRILLRFAGPRLSGSTQDRLTPIPLRSGFRSLDGNLQFGAAPRQLRFEDGTALSGLEMRDDLKLNRQILARPGFDLSQHLWASLEDGTPLITARQIGEGLLILIHVTADPSWSDLPLSGVFPQMLNRIVDMIPSVSSGNAQNVFEDYQDNAQLRPVALLDGYGRLQSLSRQAQESFRPVAFTQNFIPSQANPPGLYRFTLGGTSASQGLTPFNLSDMPLKDLNQLLQPAAYPKKARVFDLSKDKSQDLAPFFFALAALLFLIDCLITIASSTRLGGSGMGSIKSLLILGVFSSFIVTPVIAQNAQGPEIWTQGLYLAYIKSGDSALDQEVEQGLQTLANVMRTRTSAEPNGVVALSVDELNQMSYFPLVYWPIDDNSNPFRQKPLNAEQQRAVANYLNHGGTILFDVMSPLYAFNGASPALRNITEGLSISTLIEPPEETVLGKSFYLLDRLQGNKPGKIWIEQSPQSGRDEVSAVIVSTLDLAGAWGQQPEMAQRRKQEMAWRSGINIMMYVLTGNYKADQVHLPHILRRLGQ